jgi:hypothetical protein
MKMLEVGTPLWSNGFGCITWLGEYGAGVAFLCDGEPSHTGVVPLSAARQWANGWESVLSNDGRIQTVVE